MAKQDDWKCRAVLRVLKGEDTVAVASEVEAEPQRLDQWVTGFVAAGRRSLDYDREPWTGLARTVVALFFLSGLSTLVYEVAWVRLLTLSMAVRFRGNLVLAAIGSPARW